MKINSSVKGMLSFLFQERSREVGKLNFLYEALVEGWSNQDLEFSFSVSTIFLEFSFYLNLIIFLMSYASSSLWLQPNDWAMNQMKSLLPQVFLLIGVSLPKTTQNNTKCLTVCQIKFENRSFWYLNLWLF